MSEIIEVGNIEDSYIELWTGKQVFSIILPNEIIF